MELKGIKRGGGSGRQTIKTAGGGGAGKKKKKKGGGGGAGKPNKCLTLGRVQMVHWLSQKGILLFTITHKQGLGLLNEVSGICCNFL